MKFSGRRLRVSPWVTLFIGYVLGYILYPVLQMWTCRCDHYARLDRLDHHTRQLSMEGGHVLLGVDKPPEEFAQNYLHPSATWQRPQKLGRPRTLSGEYQVRKKLLVGIMTAEKYLPTRARAVHETWGTGVTEILFFVGADCNTSHPAVRHLPIVKLPGIPDNVYPPQKKVFAVLQYMKEHYLEKFQWFMRADDDIYIRGDKLQDLLSSFNPNEMIYLGRAGTGKAEDIKRLGLRSHERYCMGGPGVVFSNAALRSLAPHLDRCLHAVDMYNEENPDNPWYNEDVELGRCVSRVINIQCSTSAEGRKYFFQDYTSAALSPQSLWHNPAFRDVITLHPIKQPEHLHTVHHFYEVVRARKVEEELQSLQRAIRGLCEKIPSRLWPPWQVMDSCSIEVCSGAWPRVGQARYSSSPPFVMAAKLPKVLNPSSLYELSPWKHFSTTAEHDICGLSPEHGLYSSFRSEIAGVVSLLEHHINTGMGTASELQPVEVVGGYTRFTAEVGREYILDIRFSEEEDNSRLVTKRVRLIRPLGRDITLVSERPSSLNPVSVVVPVLRADRTFFQFMAWYETASMQGEVQPHLVLPVTGDSNTLYTVRMVAANHTRRHPQSRATVLPGRKGLSLSGALELATPILDSTALVFIADVSLRIHPQFFQNCLQNTIAGQKVYVPMPYVVFSEPEMGMPGPGHWGFYSLSSLCIYRSDLLTLPHSPGLLFQQISKSGLELFQAPDPSLVQVVRPEACRQMEDLEAQEYCRDLSESRQVDPGLVGYMFEHDRASRMSLSFTERP